MSAQARTQPCSGCGVLLAVPPRAPSFRCFVCHTLTAVRQPDLIRQAASWVKGLITKASGAINSYDPYRSSSSASYYGYPGNSFAPPYAYSGYEPVERPPSYPPAHGRKRALLCGVSYKSRKYELNGTVNDVRCMRYMLWKQFGFPDDCIMVLTEEEGDPWRVPTKQNMRAAMQWLVHGCRAGDSLVFHFSGHGTQLPDATGVEVDGLDEVLCPLDYEAAGTILDDEINDTLVRPLPHGAKLHAIVDACHSGTVLDLDYLCRMNRAGNYEWEDHSPPSHVYKGTSGGLAISFSGCDDNQTSADTSALSRITTTGAMTYCFIQAVESEPGITYGRMLNAMRSAIRDADRGFRLNGPIASLVKKVFNFGFTQEPQLCSSERFDIYQKRFVL